MLTSADRSGRYDTSATGTSKSATQNLAAQVAYRVEIFRKPREIGKFAQNLASGGSFLAADRGKARKFPAIPANRESGG